MKKAVLILTIIITLCLCSCSTVGNAGIIDNDHRTAQGTIEELLDAIQSKDKDALTSLFSKDSLGMTQSFDKSVEQLFDYFEGTVESYDDGGGLFVDTTKEDDQIIQVMESSCEVKTTECEYRIAIQYITKDTSNANRIGIQSLYVIKAAEDSDLECAYWGDAKFTPGINIGIPNAD